jgi:hypothetical protein
VWAPRHASKPILWLCWMGWGGIGLWRRGRATGAPRPAARRGWRGRVPRPRLPIYVMPPQRSASTSPELSATSSEPSDLSSSDGEQLPAQQTTRSGRVSRPPNRDVPSPGKLGSDRWRDTAARRASGEAAAAKRQRAAGASRTRCRVARREQNLLHVLRCQTFVACCCCLPVETRDCLEILNDTFVYTRTGT